MSARTRSAPKPQTTRRVKSPAQAMVEFGLALPILLLVVYGMIESGRLLFMYASVVSAARQAVRYGSVSGENGLGTPQYNDCDGIRNAAKRMGFLQPIQDSDIQISYDEGPGTGPISTTCPLSDPPVNGDRITVQVSTDFAPIVPLVRFDPFTITSTGTRTLLMGVHVAVDVPAVGWTPGATGDISLSKSASPSSYTGTGQQITYTYTITNIGSTPISNISMTDTNIDGAVNCSGAIDPLPGGAATTCTAVHTTDGADVAPPYSLTNDATVTAQSDTGPIIAFTSLTIYFIPEPRLALVKDGEAPGIIEPGALIDYTFTLTNTGNVELTQPFTIIDTIASNLQCPQEPLPVGGTKVCTGEYALKNNDITSRSVSNTATARALHNGYTVTSNPSTVSVPVPPMLLEFRIPPTTTTYPGLGGTISYQYKLTNRQWRTRYNIVITDRLGSFTCTGTLYGYASVTCPSTPRTYTGYGQTEVDAGQIVNQAIAVAQGNIRSNQVTSIIVIPQTPQLTLDKTGSPLTATTLGDVVTYQYKLTNSGNVTLSPPFAVSDDKATVSCANLTTTLAPNGGVAFCTPATHTVDAADLAAGSIINTATATAKFGTQTITSAPDTVTVVTYPGARLGLTKSANPSYFSTTVTNITYTFTLRNTGGQVLNAPYSVIDPFIPSVNCTGASPTIPIGGTTTCTGQYTVSPADQLLGSFTNTATATANGGALSSSPASLTIDKFTCNNSKIKHAEPTPIASGSSVPWVIINNSGIPLSITAMTVSWSSAPPLLSQIQLNGATIYSGSTSASGGFIVPGQPWVLPEGNVPMQLDFKNTTGIPMTATGIRVVLTISGPSCNVIVNSDVVYPS